MKLLREPKEVLNNACPVEIRCHHHQYHRRRWHLGARDGDQECPSVAKLPPGRDRADLSVCCLLQSRVKLYITSRDQI